MYRSVLSQLAEWQQSPSRKPLILKGARQVGKTWLLKHFGEANFQNVVYINMEDDSPVKEIFSLDLDPHRIIHALESTQQTKITPDNTLIIFDEVQAVPRALTSLKYFCEDAPEYHVAVAGSLLGVALHQGTSFPVGKVDFIEVRPMSFAEFLYAIGKSNLAELISDGQFTEGSNFLHQTILDHLRDYMVIGGMPEAVQAFVDGADFTAVRAIQQRIVDAYELDFSKHAPHSEYPKIREIYDSIPTCLTRENKKFIFQAIRESARAREYEAALLWVEDTGLAERVTRVNAAKLPLKAYGNRNIFKLFLSDIGLLGAKIGLTPEMILRSDDLLVEYKGALAEQFIFQELRASSIQPYYFSNDDSRGEIDFLLQTNTGILPLEVKSGKNLNSVSLNNFINKWQLPKAVKLSTLPYQPHGRVCNLPLYLAGSILKLAS